MTARSVRFSSGEMTFRREEHMQPCRSLTSPGIRRRRDAIKVRAITPDTVGLLNAYRMTARSGLDDFEAIRVPSVVPVSEEESGLEDSWKLGEWEKLDALGFKRTYSEVAQGFVDGKDPPNTPGCSRLTPSHTEDDSWEYL